MVFSDNAVIITVIFVESIDHFDHKTAILVTTTAILKKNGHFGYHSAAYFMHENKLCMKIHVLIHLLSIAKVGFWIQSQVQ